MTLMITVTFDPERKLVRAVMCGLLTVEEVEQFSRDEQDAVRRMGLASGEFLLLIDTLTQQVQTQEVMDAFRALMLDSPLKARRIATVRQGVLNRMQSRRIVQVRSAAEVFDNVTDAEAWLFAGETELASSATPA